MKLKNRVIYTIILMLLSIFIHLFSADEIRVEKFYATGFFPAFSKTLRNLFGFIPFSIGDIFYGAAVVFLILKGFQFFRFLFSKSKRTGAKEKLYPALISCLNVLLGIYVIFNIFWGINYNREGIAKQIGLEIKPFSVEDLKKINALLVQKINLSKTTLVNSQIKYPNNEKLFVGVDSAYKNISKKYPFLKYTPVSMKSSLWGWFGNYTGFTGYYNPFTGEAQVNTSVPKFTQAYTACHEAAHGIGYAKEMEANFAGYLAATASTDTLFHYSVYTDLFLYANRSLFFADTAAASQFRKQLLPAVINDFKERARFNRIHTSFMEPIVRLMYGRYLKMNKQPKGLWSYDEVTSFIVAYYKKFGTI
jgi:hypothetical protein